MTTKESSFNMNVEVWKPFRDTRYDISNMGRVRSTNRPDKSGHIRLKQCGIMKPKKTKRGYLSIQISGKWLFIHRMIAEVFVINDKHPDISLNELVVDHIDNNKTNNNAKNLQWLTQKENTNKAYKDGLIPEMSAESLNRARNRFLEINKTHRKCVEIYDKRNDLYYSFKSAREASLAFNYSKSYFSEIITKKNGNNLYWEAKYV